MNETLEAILNLETVVGFIATGVVIEVYRHFSKKENSAYEKRENYSSRNSKQY